MQITVSRVGSGTIKDDESGKTSVWAKLYARDNRFTDNDMFTGSLDVEYPVCDKETLDPSPELANKIKDVFRTQKCTTLKLTCEFAHKVSAKKAQLVVVGFTAPAKAA